MMRTIPSLLLTAVASAAAGSPATMRCKHERQHILAFVDPVHGGWSGRLVDNFVGGDFSCVGEQLVESNCAGRWDLWDEGYEPAALKFRFSTDADKAPPFLVLTVVRSHFYGGGEVELRCGNDEPQRLDVSAASERK